MTKPNLQTESKQKPIQLTLATEVVSIVHVVLINSTYKYSVNQNIRKNECIADAVNSQSRYKTYFTNGFTNMLFPPVVGL